MSNRQAKQVRQLQTELQWHKSYYRPKGDENNPICIASMLVRLATAERLLGVLAAFIGRMRGGDKPSPTEVLWHWKKARVFLSPDVSEGECPDCGGTGDLGAAPDGRLIACETCGGHEDRLGTGKETSDDDES